MAVDAGSSAISTHKIVKMLSLTSSATFIALLFSAVGNKIIALNAGTEGIALLGLYRNLSATVISILSLGYGMLFIQQIAATRVKTRIFEILGAAALLFVVQSVIIVVMLIFIPVDFVSWFVGHGEAVKLWVVRVVLMMALLNLASQTVQAILKGCANLRPYAISVILGSAFTLTLSYPLVRCGEIGLGLYIGIGNILSLGYGLYMLVRIHEPTLDCWNIGKSLHVLRTSWATSIMVYMQACISNSGYLFVRTAIQRNVGLSGLGDFNAAMMIVDTVVMVLLTAGRTYLIPALGEAGQKAHRESIFDRTASIIYIVTTLISMTIILLSGLITTILFSAKFSGAAELLRILSIALVGLALAWTYNGLLWVKNEVSAIVTMDVMAHGLFFIAACYMMSHGFLLQYLAWAYVASFLLCGLAYMFYTISKFGIGYLSRRNILLMVNGAACVAVVYMASKGSSMIILVTAYLIAAAYYFKIVLREIDLSRLLDVMQTLVARKEVV